MAVGFLSPTTYATGLTLITAQTMTTNTLNFTNVFNSTYSHYLLIGNGYNSLGTTLLIRSRQNTTDYSSSGYYGATWRANYNGTTSIDARNNQDHAYCMLQSSSSAQVSILQLTLFPNGNSLMASGTYYDQYNNGTGVTGFTMTGSATCTGFTLFNSSGTQNGNFWLYGYKKA